MGRGLEGMILAMKHLEKFNFFIFGAGPREKELKSLAKDLNLEERVSFMGCIPFDKLRAYTRQASLGISLEENLGLNYYYSLPNKLFDYIQAQVPVLVSDFPEMRSVVKNHGIGEVLENPEPPALAKQIKRMMQDQEQRMVWKKNLRKAAGELCWEMEADRLKDVFINAGLTFP
jgi:glycosyltransferase involved in cell wall biosynthesis